MKQYYIFQPHNTHFAKIYILLEKHRRSFPPSICFPETARARGKEITLVSGFNRCSMFEFSIWKPVKPLLLHNIPSLVRSCWADCMGKIFGWKFFFYFIFLVIWMNLFYLHTSNSIYICKYIYPDVNVYSAILCLNFNFWCPVDKAICF